MNPPANVVGDNAYGPKSSNRWLAIGEDNALYHFNENSSSGWKKERDSIRDMAVDGYNRIWVVANDGSIYINGTL